MIFSIFILLAALAGYFIYYLILKRRNDLIKLAAALGMVYRQKGCEPLDQRYPDLKSFEPLLGPCLEAEDIVDGKMEDCSVELFNYGRGDSGCSACVLITPQRRGRLFICDTFNLQPRQRLGSDIDFESAKFSKRYFVRADDKQFAYEVITPQMMEFLLDYNGFKWQRWIEIEISGNNIASIVGLRLNSEGYRSLYDFTWKFYQMMGGKRC